MHTLCFLHSAVGAAGCPCYFLVWPSPALWGEYTAFSCMPAEAALLWTLSGMVAFLC